MRLATAILILATLTAVPLPAIGQSPPEFPFKVEGFIARYNRALKTLHVPIKKISIKDQKEEGDEIEFDLHQSNGQRKFMFIKVVTGKESGRIRSILYVASKEKSHNLFFFQLTLITEIEAVIMALESPAMDKEERDKRVKEIGLQQSLKEKRNIASTENFVDYVVGPLKSIGVITLLAKPNPDHFYNK